MFSPSITEWGTDYRIPYPNLLPTSSKADWPKRPVEAVRPPFLAEKTFRNPTTICHKTFGCHHEGILVGAWCVVSAFSAHCPLSRGRAVARALHNGVQRRRPSKWPKSQTTPNIAGGACSSTRVSILCLTFRDASATWRPRSNF